MVDICRWTRSTPSQALTLAVSTRELRIRRISVGLSTDLEGVFGVKERDDNASTHSPPSVVMSQYTFKGLPRFSGSIQYSPSSVAAPLSRMSLHDLPGFAFSPSLISKKNQHC